MTLARVGIIGLGEVGRILAEDLLANSDAGVRVWDYQFHNADSVAAQNLQALVSSGRILAAESAATAVEGCQLVLSAVTADQALKAAESVLPALARNSLFVDLNSVSPGTKQGIAELLENAGGRFVEASVMSPIMPLRTGSPLLLCGPWAPEGEAALRTLGFSDLRVVSETLGVASATKMCRSVIVKGIEALVTESLLAARYYRVEDAVLASLDNLFPGPVWPEHARYLISRSVQHGTRRAAEMHEVAKTIEEAGLNPWMSEGSLARQAWAPQFDAALGEETLAGMLDSIRAQFSSMQRERER